MDIAKKGSIIADFSQSAGAVNKMLHCSNYMPCISIQNILNFNDAYAKMYFTAARTHDQALNNAGQRLVDTHFIFPRFDADADDEKNYCFSATDYLLQNTLDCGTQIYYRLGTSIEHTLDDHHFNAARKTLFTFPAYFHTIGTYPWHCYYVDIFIPKSAEEFAVNFYTPNGVAYFSGFAWEKVTKENTYSNNYKQCPTTGSLAPNVYYDQMPEHMTRGYGTKYPFRWFLGKKNRTYRSAR